MPPRWVQGDLVTEPLQLADELPLVVFDGLTLLEVVVTQLLVSHALVQDVGLAARHVVHVRRVQQPALHLALEQLPHRLPITAGRLHPHPGHPEAGQPLGQQHQPSGRRGEPAGLGVTPTLAVGHPHTRSPSPYARPDPRSVQPASPPARLLHLGNPIAAIRRSLSQGNLSLVLAATVRGARGSHVRLISGLAAPRERRRRPHDQPIFIRRGWPTTAMGGL
jgi:hypothetical protein